MESLFPNIQHEPEWLGFIEMRKKIKKPMTDRALKLAENRLEKLAPRNIELQKKILDQSTFNCWLDLYPLSTCRKAMSTDTKSEYIQEIEAMIQAAEII